ncbi:uncharacterized protein LOC100371178 isoform X2 [Saccoglossus kowalevskii]|uniref:Uncharacterized protein LOC100371178 isoform X2 n=1 Tax=Saccoglossus kowalevskii TaxID=10224 RepID=A0ABM0MS66_SACKO|nr:PREDICTED: uncharacterized protein LOC100371178 isoform X2 [Saccoglossus kowalevskii]
MPLITKCMCWDNIYSASRAAAMYTLCLSTNLLLLYLFKFSTYIPAHDEDPFMVVVYKAWFLLLLIYALYFITSFILLNGIEKAFVGMVLFFLTFLVAAEIIETGIIVLLLVEGGFTSTIHVEFSLYIVKLVPNILIFVVVLSCYQALKEQKRNEKNYDDLVRKRDCSVMT